MWACPQVETLTDSLKRTLAEMENLRARTAREVDVSKKFAIQVGLATVSATCG